MVRQRPPFSSLEHLDLLFGARRLWNLRFDSCRLVELENQILGVERQGDLPGEMIPYVYFEYVRTHEIFRLDAGVSSQRHRHPDAGLPHRHRPARVSCAEQAAVFARRGNGRAGALVAASRAARKRAGAVSAGDGARIFRTSCCFAPCGTSRRWKRSSAANMPRSRCSPIWPHRAIPWRAPALVELAKYYERRERNYALALEMTRSAIGAGTIRSAASAARPA